MPHTKRAFDGLEALVPKLKEKFGPFESMLYIGVRHDMSPWWFDWLCPALGVSKVGVLEIYPPNLADFEQQVWSGRYPGVTTILGDASGIGRHIGRRDYDVIFWDHGPEHSTKEELDKTTELLKVWTNKLLLYVCPWGVWEQGEEDGNKYEEHKCSLYIKDLEEYGMTVHEFGKPHQEGEGELIAYIGTEHYLLTKGGY